MAKMFQLWAVMSIDMAEIGKKKRKNGGGDCACDEVARESEINMMGPFMMYCTMWMQYTIPGISRQRLLIEI